MPSKSIVYLFGAGATIAEAVHAGIEQKLSLSLREVSERVVQKAKKKKGLRDLLGEAGQINDIERYISLLESLGVKKYSAVATRLRDIFCDCVQEGLILRRRPIDPLLSMALLEMHSTPLVSSIEQLKGIITLNYDNLIDIAFNEVLEGVNYGIVCASKIYTIKQNVPMLIKLHGSFNWRTGFPIRVVGHGARSGKMIWIPPGIEKEMDRYPFNFLWGKAFELLLGCDTLRIVGCSLSQNDWGLMSLLFSSQLTARPKPKYQIELITQHDTGQDIRNKNGFLKNLKALGELDGCQDFIDAPPPNVFEDWLKTRLKSFLPKNIDKKNLKYVNKLMRW